jgi:tetratricopeptide (TPR) repeat protein
MGALPHPVEVFISYAQEDRSFLEQLATHLSILQRRGLIAIWHEGQIPAGTERLSTIDEQLQLADLILLLISPDYLASTQRYERELQRALERHEGRKARVIPVLVRPVVWDLHPLSKLQALPRNTRPVSTWSNRDKVWAEITQDIQAAIFELDYRPDQPLSMKTPSVWAIPYTRNPFFTGRDDILDLLATRLDSGQAIGLTQPQAVSGLGGIGKTQLAVEYAYRYQERYQAILWAESDSHELLTAAYVQFARQLELIEQEEHDQSRIIAAVQHWLQEHQKWLLILDNVEDLGLLSIFLPTRYQGHVLLTTRMQVTEPLAFSLELESLPEEEGALLLLRRTKRLTHDAPLDFAVAEEHLQAMAISRTLGGLPLALDQAGAYILETGCAIADYLPIYEHKQAVLLARRSQVPADHPQSVATTFSLALERARRKNSASVKLLYLCAFFAPDAIPEALIMQEKRESTSKLWPVMMDSFTLNKAMEVLRSLSLIQRYPGEKLFRLHRLVQAMLKTRMSMSEQRTWIEHCIRLLNYAFPTERMIVGELKWCEQLVPHVLTSDIYSTPWTILPLERASLFHKTANYLFDRAEYIKAKALYEQTIRIREQALGLDHPDVADSLHNLAHLYEELGKYEQAEPLYQRTILIWEKALGPDYPHIAHSLHGLANIYRKQGKYDQAEPLYQRAIHIGEQALESDLAHYLLNLAHLYEIQGKYDQAEPLYQRALFIWEQVLGSGHPDVAHPLHGLASLCRKQKKYEQAEILYERALYIGEQALGPDHPNVAHSLHGLASLYEEQGKYEQAELLYQRVLHIREDALGPDHYFVAHPLHGLANVYREQRKYEDAEQFFLRALTICEQRLGFEHPEVAALLHSLAVCYQKQGNLVEAERLYECALAIRKQSFGLQHPDTRTTLLCYITLLDTTGRSNEAAVLETYAVENRNLDISSN